MICATCPLIIPLTTGGLSSSGFSWIPRYPSLTCGILILGFCGVLGSSAGVLGVSGCSGCSGCSECSECSGCSWGTGVSWCSWGVSTFIDILWFVVLLRSFVGNVMGVIA